MKKVIKQVQPDEERELLRITSAKKSVIYWGKFPIRIGWMLPYTLEKITEVSLNCKKESEIPARTAALVYLNGLFSIFFFYHFLWRWMYHYLPSNVISAIVTEGKKKEESLTQESWTAIILTTMMRTTKMSLKKEEAERILLGQRTEKHGK